MHKFVLALLLLLPCLAIGSTTEAIGWGVVTGESPAYNKAGKPVGNLKGGEQYTLLRKVAINKEPAYFVVIENHKKKPQCIIPGKACRNFDEVPPTDPAELVVFKRKQELCAEYYATYALRETLLKRAKERHTAKSPVAALEKAKAELAAIPAKDRKYEEAQKKAKTNGERLKYQDMRKALRWDLSGLKVEIERLEGEAKAWEATHPFNDASVRKGAVWKRLTAQLDATAAQLDALGISITPED